MGLHGAIVASVRPYPGHPFSLPKHTAALFLDTSTPFQSLWVRKVQGRRL